MSGARPVHRWLCACLIVLASEACATRRWAEQWRGLPPPLRVADADGGAGEFTVLGNRGMRFGERIGFISQRLQSDMSTLMNGRPSIPVHCQAAPDECNGVISAHGGDIHVDLILRNVMIRLAAVEALYLETENHEAVARVGPFPVAFHLDTGRASTVRVDGSSASCVAAEAYVLTRSELRRVGSDVSKGRVTSDEARNMAEQLAVLGDHPMALCRK